MLSELKRRGARKKLQRLCYLGKDLKDDFGWFEFKAAFLADLEVLQRVPVLVE